MEIYRLVLILISFIYCMPNNKIQATSFNDVVNKAKAFYKKHPVASIAVPASLVGGAVIYSHLLDELKYVEPIISHLCFHPECKEKISKQVAERMAYIEKTKNNILSLSIRKLLKSSLMHQS